MLYPEGRGRREKVGWRREGITVNQILPTPHCLLAIAQQGSSLSPLFHNYCGNVAYWCPLTPLTLGPDRKYEREGTRKNVCEGGVRHIINFNPLVTPTEDPSWQETTLYCKNIVIKHDSKILSILYTESTLHSRASLTTVGKRLSVTLYFYRLF